MIKNILITGATGFIGSHVAERFLDNKKYRVVLISRKEKDYKNINDLKRKGAKVFEGNFFDRNLLKNIFAEISVDYVVHIAALRGGGKGTGSLYRTVNVTGTESLLEFSLENKVNKFIFCSSVGVYGTIPGNLPADLNTSFNGDNRYHLSKIKAEEYVGQYIDRGLNAFIIRPAITYGRGDDGFPSTLISLAEKKMFLLSGEDIKIHLLDVRKFAELTELILDKEIINSRYFIAADHSPIELKKLIDLIHYRKHERHYPPFLVLPSFFFKLAFIMFSMIKNEKWKTRMQLISKSWYYDISGTVNNTGYSPSKTEDAFPDMIQ